MDGQQSSQRIQASILKDGLRILREALELATSSSFNSNAWSDAFIIAIDFENTVNIGERFFESKNSQVDLATLDTRNLRTSYLPESLISTHNFVTGPPSYIRKVLVGF
jgi:hypothetical protein